MLRYLAPLLALLGLPAAAQSYCDGQTQIDMTYCAQERWQIADAELNRLWSRVKPVADARGTGTALLAEQRAWLKRRDATCEPALSSGGSGAQMFYWLCMEDATLQRNAVLRDLQ